MPGDDYKVELEVFEGPLDLLLYLIKKEEVNIYNIPIERVTSQYMEYLGVMRMLDLNIAGEFIVMAATLMMIKSRMLLPVEERSEEEDEEEDPRWELVRQLVEYKKFKDAANRLEEKELLQANVFGIGGAPLDLEPEDAGVVLQDVNLFDLLAAFNEVLKNAKVDDIREIAAEHFTVADKIEAVLAQLRRGKPLPFTRLFSRMASRAEIICTFLAILELARLRQLAVVQETRFSTIMLEAVEEADDPTDGADRMQEETIDV